MNDFISRNKALLIISTIIILLLICCLCSASVWVIAISRPEPVDTVDINPKNDDDTNTPEENDATDTDDTSTIAPLDEPESLDDLETYITQYQEDLLSKETVSNLESVGFPFTENKIFDQDAANNEKYPLLPNSFGMQIPYNSDLIPAPNARPLDEKIYGKSGCTNCLAEMVAH